MECPLIAGRNITLYVVSNVLNSFTCLLYTTRHVIPLYMKYFSNHSYSNKTKMRNDVISCEMLRSNQRLGSSHPGMVSDAADGDHCVSGQKKVVSHFFSQSHRTKSVQITENHLPLCPVCFTHTKYTFNKDESNLYFTFPNDHVIMQNKVITPLPSITLTAVCRPCQCSAAAQIMCVGGWVRRIT